MARHWKELLPIDFYSVSSNGMLHDYDRKVLSLLYQPLIGALPISLYFTLWSELEQNRIHSGSINSHRTLMSLMQLRLDDIFEARKKLEGIGLLKVWRRKQEEERHFFYELQPPLSPEEFFNDAMLNIYLHKKLGKQHYQKLKSFFSDQKVATESYEHITKSFSEVFASGHFDSLYISDELKEDIKIDASETFIGRGEGAAPSGFMDTFDFELFASGLSKSFISEKAFTPRVKEMIAKIAFLYDINPIQMQSLVLRAIDEKEEVNIELLRKIARDWYQIEYGDDLPSLAQRTQPLHLRTGSSEPKTEEERHIRHLETVSPLKRLSELSGGGEPSKADIDIIEGIMFNQQLPPGVVNVLIEYVMIKTDMRLSKSYVEKIASHWARKKIKTVKEAMELAKKEHQQYLSWQVEKKNKKATTSTSKKVIRQEYIPEWMKEENKDQPKNTEITPELERKRKQLEEEFKRLKKR
jgi:replication initiation and membrane attachment protein